MKRFILAPLAALLGLLILNSFASAQFTYPIQGAQRYPGWQTPLSPYLNMLRGGDPAANYFIGVLPEFQRRQDRNIMYPTLQTLTNQLPPRPGLVEPDIDRPLGSTGHPVAFGYTGNYFGGPAGMTRSTSNPFPPQRQAGPKSKWPRGNTPQPAGQKPKTP
ncbi:MAG TPA: hypothetical protein VH643_32455 [Gemmataceae bacterium]|jgi:hypothetical protein